MRSVSQPLAVAVLAVIAVGIGCSRAHDSGTDGGVPGDAAMALDAGARVPCAAIDVRGGRACGPAERPGPRYGWDGTACAEYIFCGCAGRDCDLLFDSPEQCHLANAECLAACAGDADCAVGAAWCEAGRCVPCDDAGTRCTITCPRGWAVYTRNGCTPCECAPPNECESDPDCDAGTRCVAGAFCWFGCADGDPSCCRGNLCAGESCAAPPPVGCFARGCPRGQTCAAEGCAASICTCAAGATDWSCTADCGGGTCR